MKNGGSSLKAAQGIALLCLSLLLCLQGIYGDLGFEVRDPDEHVPFANGERVDFDSAEMALSFVDIHLPGPNGFDVDLHRVYPSKLYAGQETFSGRRNYLQLPKDWLGLGWTMHMGRIYVPQALSSTSKIEIRYPNGPKGSVETIIVDVQPGGIY